MCVHMLGQYFEGSGSVHVCVCCTSCSGDEDFTDDAVSMVPYGRAWGCCDTSAIKTSLDPAADIAVCGPLILYHWPREMLCPS